MGTFTVVASITSIQRSSPVTDRASTMKFAIAVCALVAVANARPGSNLNIGASGAIADGQLVQFTKPGVTLVAEGPSAFLFSDGTAIQKRSKRSATSEFGDVIGASGAISADGQSIHIPEGVTVAAVGPSAILLSNGQAIQRNKRSVNEFGDNIGAAGVVANGQNVQLPPGVHVVQAGPSAILFSDGTALQRSKRSVTDHADIIGTTGGLINGQSFHFVDQTGAPKTIASRGASGIVFSDGTSIQFTA